MRACLKNDMDVAVVEASQTSSSQFSAVRRIPSNSASALGEEAPIAANLCHGEL